MAGKVAFVDEVGEHLLIKGRLAQVHDATHGDKTVDQIGWDDDVPEPQRRKKNLAESSDVHDSGILVEPLQRRDRQALITVFAVIVVFDDPRARVVRPLHQLQSPSRAHRYAERELVRWRDKGSPRLSTLSDAGRNIEALAVHWDRLRTASVQSENVPGQSISRIFDPHPIARAEKNASCDLECLLGAVDYQDLLRFAAHRPRRPKIIRDRLPQ